MTLGLLTGFTQSAFATGEAHQDWEAKAQEMQLHRSGVWRALLHMQSGAPQINDPGFLLSHAQFSDEAELQATINYLYGPQSTQAVCRYPARYLWLQRQLALPPLSLDHCQALQEFLARAPADQISLVFASENLSQPSSMMGHLFLKVAGHRRDGAPVAHSIAFFTDTNTLNLPKLLYDSMVVGKQGFFTLSPYQDSVQLYAVEEQRTLWEYQLQLDDFSRSLIQAHLHELRQADITYFFQSFNCATLVQNILAINSPQLNTGRNWWTTPKSVVQNAQAAGLVADTSVNTSSRWRVRSLSDSLSNNDVSIVRELVETRQAPTQANTYVFHEGPRGYLQLELARAYNAYLLEENRIDVEDWRTFTKTLNSLQQQRYANLALQADESKNPVNTPSEGQVSLGWRHILGRAYVQVGLQPVSHALVDDNRHRLSESELRLFDTALLLDSRSGRIKLDHFTLYAVESLLPRDAMTGGLSGRFKVSVESQPQLQQPGKNVGLIEGAGGFTWRLGNDVDVFALLGAGWGTNPRGYLYSTPQIGFVIREVFNMKTVLRFSEVSRPNGQTEASRELAVTQSKYLNQNYNLIFSWRRIWQDRLAANEGQVLLKRLF